MKRYSVDESTNVTEYNSISEFIHEIESLPNNQFFENRNDSQKCGDREWYGTSDYDEAKKLMATGWTSAATKMASKIKLTSSNSNSVKTTKPVYGVVGSQACVPLYLQGVPTNMVSRKVTYTKQKVVTITKGISYSSFWTAEQMLNEGIKAIQIIQSMENGGQRVKLNVLLAVTNYKEVNICKICIKQPDERLNISKMSFALAHPSMLRRLGFKWIEVDPSSKTDMGYNYGRIASREQKQKAMSENEYYLNEKIGDINEFIKTITNKH